MTGRRGLTFDRLDEVMTDVDRLLEGHRTVGNWSLGQILHHLAVAVRLTGRRRSPPAGGSPIVAALRHSWTRAKYLPVRLVFFRRGRIPEGLEVPMPALDPPPGVDERAAARSLGEAIAALGRAEGPFPAHPLLGPLTRDEWAAFHRIHCAHHLRFAVPVPASTPTGVTP